jgi:hypothetical protein
MTKYYTAHEAAELLGIEYEALRKQLQRDLKRDKKQRKYPNAYKTECCGIWMIPAKDLNLSDNS